MPVKSGFDRFILAFCQVGPCGLSPVAPGTVGSLAAVLAAPLLFMPLLLEARLILLAALFILGGMACTRAEKLLGRKDPGSLVIDEVFGQWASLLLFTGLAWWELALAFGLFRFFDISKIWPINRSETWLPGGFGVMIDDFVAGLYAGGALLLIRGLLSVAG